MTRKNSHIFKRAYLRLTPLEMFSICAFVSPLLWAGFGFVAMCFANDATAKAQEARISKIESAQIADKAEFSFGIRRANERLEDIMTYWEETHRKD